MKNHPMTSGLPFSCKLRWGSYSLSIAKAACYKIESLVRQWSFFLLSLLIISINQLRNLAWDTIFMTRLVLLVTLWIFGMSYRTVNHSFETLPHCLNVATLSLFCRCCFGRCSSDLAELFLLPYLIGRSTRYSNRFHDFFVTILGCFNDVSVSSFFPCTARLWNSLPAECFPLTYYWNGF